MTVCYPVAICLENQDPSQPPMTPHLKHGSHITLTIGQLRALHSRCIADLSKTILLLMETLVGICLRCLRHIEDIANRNRTSRKGRVLLLRPLVPEIQSVTLISFKTQQVSKSNTYPARLKYIVTDLVTKFVYKWKHVSATGIGNALQAIFLSLGLVWKPSFKVIGLTFKTEKHHQEPS